MQEFRRVNQFALLMIGVMLFGSTLVSTVLNWLGSDSLLVKYILLYGIQFVLPIVGFCITDRGQSPRELMRLRRPKGYTFVLTIFFAVAIQPFLMCISSLTSLLFHNYLNDSMVKYMEEPLGITLLAVAVIPAFCEELLCRGIYLSGCKRLNIYLAAILGGIFFGVLHMNPQQAVYAAVFGFLCSMIVMGADSHLAGHAGTPHHQRSADSIGICAEQWIVAVIMAEGSFRLAVAGRDSMADSAHGDSASWRRCVVSDSDLLYRRPAGAVKGTHRGERAEAAYSLRGIQRILLAGRDGFGLPSNMYGRRNSMINVKNIFDFFC